jgi:hypothetical protein
MPVAYSGAALKLELGLWCPSLFVTLLQPEQLDPILVSSTIFIPHHDNSFESVL